MVVGGRELLDVDRIEGIRPTWAGAPLAEAAAGDWFDCHLQFRAHGDIVPALARVDDGGERWLIRPEHPLRGVAPGQTAVLYRGTRVLGQVTIDRARNRALDEAPGPDGERTAKPDRDRPGQ